MSQEGFTNIHRVTSISISIFNRSDLEINYSRKGRISHMEHTFSEQIEHGIYQKPKFKINKGPFIKVEPFESYDGLSILSSVMEHDNGLSKNNPNVTLIDFEGSQYILVVSFQKEIDGWYLDILKIEEYTSLYQRISVNQFVPIN